MRRRSRLLQRSNSFESDVVDDLENGREGRNLCEKEQPEKDTERGKDFGERTSGEDQINQRANDGAVRSL